jgi:hypothetical protein
MVSRSVSRLGRLGARFSTLFGALLGFAMGAMTQSAEARPGIAAYAGARTGSGFQSSASATSGEALQLRSSGAGSIALEAPYDDNRLLQLFVSHQRTRLGLGSAAATGSPTTLPLTVTHAHVGGINYFESVGGGGVGRGPYVAGGLGLTHLSPNLPGTASRTRASMSLALGHEWPLLGSSASSGSLGPGALTLRVELRGYATLLRSDGGFFCSGGCTVFVQGETLTQVEAMVGLRLAF